MTYRRAVVTGASSGIGRNTVELLRGKGWQVVAVARREDRLAELSARTGAEQIVADLTVKDDVDRLSEYIRDTGGADVLINNAGRAVGLDSVEESPVEDWEAMFALNVIATKRITAALLPILRMSIEPGRTASIVNVTSTAGHEVYKNGAGYNASKFAQVALTRGLRIELFGEPIRVIEVSPGMVHTEEFSLERFAGDQEKADAVYEGVEYPLRGEDIAEVITHAVELPPFVNVDHIIVKPVAQVSWTMVHRDPLVPKLSSSAPYDR